jgi:cytidylate kinase
MRRRDAADSTRDASPLRPADDAVEIDTSDLSVAEVVGEILDLVGRV